MTRRTVYVPTFIGAVLAAMGLGCAQAETRQKEGAMSREETAVEWREVLNKQEYDVLRREATEPPFSSPLNEEKRRGIFVCAACGFPLFLSGRKYESGTGWPSFYEAIPGHVATKSDHLLFTPRVEYHCARCGGHQGHVFEDGPQPTGLRYCNNGVALRFVPEEES
jgi:peptide-methionine (R)-S-oxide reductase